LNLLATISAVADPARLLPSKQDALQSRADIIAQAKEEITAEYFTVGSDEVAMAGLGLLMEASARGVKVKLLVDGISHRISKQILAAIRLNYPNFEIKVFNPFDLANRSQWFNRLHDKSLCVDGNICIVGGRNISNKYFLEKIKGTKYNDLDIVFGGPAVVKAQEYFHQLWKNKYSVVPYLHDYDPQKLNGFCSGDMCHVEQAQRFAEIGEVLKGLRNTGKYVQPNLERNWLEGAELNSEISFLHDPPDKEKSSDGITAELAKAIRKHTNYSLLIMSPYVVLTERTYGLLKELREKNVMIKIVTNSVHSTDNMISQVGYNESKKKLIELGIDVWEYKGPDTLHGKAAVMDNEYILVGSYNFDTFSDKKNREISILVGNKEIAKELTDFIEGFQPNAYFIGPNLKPVNDDGKYDQIPDGKRFQLNLFTTIGATIDDFINY
jgi:putative cardiolipin synthase